MFLDTTYFGHTFGALVLMDSVSKQVLSVDIVAYETNQLYYQAIQKLKDNNMIIQSIICDGRKGLPQLFADIPVQLCQFHQVQTVIRYLSNKPKSLAAEQLRALTLTLTKSSFSSFQAALNSLYRQHKQYVNERTINAETGKTHYTHKRLRSVYLSLKRNLPLLFTFEQYPELFIPNTTNLLESRCAGLKSALNHHCGLNLENKTMFIKDYFSN
ncbi:transposase [Kingella kingae]|nr:transposase [Kingella kingae]MDK4635424.1 transposase [Kingella kingae]